MIGQTISHYTILEKLGQGGMGVVYKAEDTRLKRTVALKFLPPDLTRDPEAKDRFIREAQAASALQHPNICTIHDFDETTDGRLFMVMDCYEGETLKDRIKNGTISFEETLQVAVQIADGLAEAHKHGIVHRDVKPANIMITTRGAVKIMDFGLVKLAGEAGVTKTGSTMGTVAYMSPEQVSGGPVDPRTDIWSYGVTLFEMWTGRLPFRGEHPAALMYSITNEDPTDVGTYRQEIPEQLQELCRCCLRKDPNDRPDSMDAIAGILKSGGYERRFLGSIRRIRLRSSYIGLVILLAVLGGVSLWFGLNRGGPAPEGVRWSIGVTPFENRARSAESRNWVYLIQSMLSHELTRVEQFAVHEPLSFNSEIEGSFGKISPAFYKELSGKSKALGLSYVLSGTIDSSADGYLVQTNTTNVATNVLEFSYERKVRNESELTEFCQACAQEIIGHFQVKGLLTGRERDLQSWNLQRPQNTEALKAFLEASRCFFKNLPGYEENLARAIRFDSTFVSPRVWLLSTLGQKGQIDAAEKEYRSLRALDSLATPFERAMIRWARAFLDRDTLGQIRCLELALEYSPRNFILLVNLGYQRYALREYERAVETIRPCLDAKWEYPALYALAGSCYLKMGKYTESGDVLRASLNIKPVHPMVYAMLAVLSGTTHEAADRGLYESEFFRVSKEYGIPPARAHAEFAESWLDVRDTAEALSHYRESLRADSLGVAADICRERIHSLLH